MTSAHSAALVVLDDPPIPGTRDDAAAEQAALLKATATHLAPRDLVLCSMALGTGLRLSELLGLNVGDGWPDARDVRRRVVLDPATTKGVRRGEVFLPERLVPKLRRCLAWKREYGESVEADARLSPRAAEWRFAWWQRKAGFDRRYDFHSIRHSAITNLYRAKHDFFLAQRIARHASPLTTIVYTHPADEGRVGDRRGGLAAPSPVPASSNAACGFPALRFPACFSPRFMRPIVLERLSAAAREAFFGSR